MCQLIKASSITICLYGAVVMASGIWRVVSAEGGSTGLWFGLVMGSIAWLSGVLYWNDKRQLANAMALCCIAVVGGWFGYESLLKKGYAHAEIRQLVVIVLSVVTVVVLCWLATKSTSNASGKVSRDGN